MNWHLEAQLGVAAAGRVLVVGGGALGRVGRARGRRVQPRARPARRRALRARARHLRAVCVHAPGKFSVGSALSGELHTMACGANFLMKAVKKKNLRKKIII